MISCITAALKTTTTATLVQELSTEAVSEYTFTVPFGTDNTAGNCIVLFIGCEYTLYAPTIYDSNNGHIYSLIATVSISGGGKQYLFIAPNIAAGPNTITLSGSNYTDWLIAGGEYSGVVTSSPVDAYVAGFDSGTSVTLSTLTTTVDADLVVAACYDHDTNYAVLSISPGSWNQRVLVFLSGESVMTTFDMLSVGVGAYDYIGSSVDVPVLEIIAYIPPAAILNTAYFGYLTGYGGFPPYSWSIVAGFLPPGLALVDNVISGVPTSAGTYTFDVQLEDSEGNTTVYEYTIAINAQGPFLVGVSGFMAPPGNQNYIFYIDQERWAVGSRFISGGMLPSVCFSDQNGLGGTWNEYDLLQYGSPDIPLIPLPDPGPFYSFSDTGFLDYVSSSLVFDNHVNNGLNPNDTPGITMMYVSATSGAANGIGVFSIADPGHDYTVGAQITLYPDVLPLMFRSAVLTVNAINVSGGVTDLTLTYTGVGYTAGTYATSSLGAGSGLVLDIISTTVSESTYNLLDVMWPFSPGLPAPLNTWGYGVPYGPLIIENVSWGQLWLSSFGIPGNGALAVASVSGGAVHDVIGGGGEWYANAIVVVVPQGDDIITSPAIITPIITSGVITGFTVVDGGAGYVHAPLLQIWPVNRYIVVYGTLDASNIQHLMYNIWDGSAWVGALEIDARTFGDGDYGNLGQFVVMDDQAVAHVMWQEQTLPPTSYAINIRSNGGTEGDPNPTFFEEVPGFYPNEFNATDAANFGGASIGQFCSNYFPRIIDGQIRIPFQYFIIVSSDLTPLAFWFYESNVNSPGFLPMFESDAPLSVYSMSNFGDPPVDPLPGAQWDVYVTYKNIGLWSPYSLSWDMSVAQLPLGPPEPFTGVLASFDYLVVNPNPELGGYNITIQVTTNTPDYLPNPGIAVYVVDYLIGQATPPVSNVVNEAYYARS